MKLTIGYVTGRHEPKLEWFLDDLIAQSQPDDEIEIVIVDVFHRQLCELAAARHRHLRCIVTPPKPCVWQGTHRVTSRDWWALSNARNTAAVLASHDYIAFLDDRCHLGPQWLETVRKGYQTHESVLAGTYTKLEDGRLTIDHRKERCPHGKIDCRGGWLFGCTSALPLEWLLDVNGFEEGCDGLGMEDVIFGLNLQNAGRRIDFLPEMLVSQERSVAFNTPTYRKTDKGISPHDKSHAALYRFGERKRTEFTPDLRDLRVHMKIGGEWPTPDRAYPHRDWYDNQLLSEMV